MSRIWVILDGDTVSRWQQQALDLLEAGSVTTILSCRNTRAQARKPRHFPYYALNLLSVRNPLTRHAPLSLAGPPPEVIEFDSLYEGAWQRLPPEIVDRIAADPPDCIVKFGMSLLRVPEGLPCPILSYHHGDPDHYRGRPAGFYEMMHGRGTMGQIVQRLSNRLDAGEVVAFAETKVIPHSYRATLMEAYRHSPPLLAEAIRNALSDRTVAKERAGPNYRLPGPATVARFVGGMAGRLARRLVYGLTVEKRWEVSTVDVDDADAVLTGGSPFPPREAWKIVPMSAAHSFQADPFFIPDGIAVEAMNKRTGKGEIAVVRPGEISIASTRPGHHSYPAGVEEDGQFFIIPEIAQWSAPRAYRLEGGKLVEQALLDIEDGPRILDPTFHRHDGRLYLFGNIAERGSNLLYLWHSDSLFGRFRAHAMSPIRISPRGARMGGSIVTGDRGLLRLGQSFVDGYGDGLFVFRIDALSETDYAETEIAALKLSDVKGPHTLNVQRLPDGRQRLLFDWYVERASPLAGLRRIKNRLG